MRFEFKNFAFLSADSVTAAEAALCAADQGQFWPYHYTLFENPNSYSESSLKRYAEAHGMDTQQFADCLEGGKHAQTVQGELAEGQAKGVSSTPAIFVNQTMFTGVQPFEVFQQAIEQELAALGQ